MAKKKMRGDMEKKSTKSPIARATPTTGDTEFASDLAYGAPTVKGKKEKQKNY